MPAGIDTKRTNEDASESPLVPSSAVESTWGIFAELSGRDTEKAKHASLDAVKVVYDFGKDLVPSTYEAAHLAPLMEELAGSDPVRIESAKQALEQYKSKNHQDLEYVRAVSVDILKINSFLDQHWENAVEVESEDEADDEPMERQYKSPWERRYKTIPMRDVLALVSDEPDDIVQNPEGVNIESILIGAGLAYNTLRNAGRSSEDEILRTMYDVDTFYRPVLEIIGYDGFVMALKREANLIRMSRNGGEYDGITDENLGIARTMLRQLPPPEKMPMIVDELVGKLTMRLTESSPVLRHTSGHGMQFGTGRVSELEDLEDSLPGPVYEATRYVWRVKTDTELARKVTIEPKVDIETGEEHVVVPPITDTLGVTVIVPSIDALDYSFNLAAGIVMNSGQLEPTHSRSRKTAFHAKGDDIIKAVEMKFPDLGAGVVLDKKKSENGHQVAKITLQFTPEGYDHPIPVEVQFQTKEDRMVARIGPAAHTFKQEGYKVADTQDLKVLRLLNTFHKRRIRTNEAGLTNHSQQSAAELFGKPKGKRGMASTGIRDFIRAENEAARKLEP